LCDMIWCCWICSRMFDPLGVRNSIVMVLSLVLPASRWNTTRSFACVTCHSGHCKGSASRNHCPLRAQISMRSDGSTSIVSLPKPPVTGARRRSTTLTDRIPSAASDSAANGRFRRSRVNRRFRTGLICSFTPRMLWANDCAIFSRTNVPPGATTSRVPPSGSYQIATSRTGRLV